MDVREMAKYIDREDLVEWLKRIPLKDLSDGRGLCRVIFEDDFKRAIKKIPKGIIYDPRGGGEGHDGLFHPRRAQRERRHGSP